MIHFDPARTQTQTTHVRYVSDDCACSVVQHGCCGHLVCQLEGVVGVELSKGHGHVHFGQGLADAVAGPVTEGEPALALLAQVQPQIIYMLAVTCLLLLLLLGLAGGV